MIRDIADAPEPTKDLIDFICEEDRRFFETHPKAKYYDRSPHPAEFWPYTFDVKNLLVRVFQISPRCRIRCPYEEGGRPDERTLQVVKNLRKAYRRGELRTPPRDERLADLHITRAV
jgi:hypothetical protein